MISTIPAIWQDEMLRLAYYALEHETDFFVGREEKHKNHAPPTHWTESEWARLSDTVVSRVRAELGLKRDHTHCLWRAVAPNPLFHILHGPVVVLITDGVHAVAVDRPFLSELRRCPYIVHTKNLLGPLGPTLEPFWWAGPSAQARPERPSPLAQALELLNSLTL